MIAATFSMAGGPSSRALTEALRERFGCRPEGRARRRIDYLDTVDWRLYRERLALSAVGDERSITLGLTAFDGTPLHRLPAEHAPAFAAELPPGPLCDALLGRVEIRRLLPRVRLEVSLGLHAIVDPGGKTVARVAFEQGSAREIGLDGRAAETRSLVPSVTVLALAGYERAAEQVAAFLGDQTRLEPLDPSPLVRTLARLELEPRWVASKPSYELTPSMPTEEALREILRVTFHAIRCNEEGLLLDVDVECVHDFRVATRRTRAALGQIRRVFPDRAVARFAREFRWLQRRTGPLRDADVFLLSLPGLRARLPAGARQGIDVLETRLERRRKRALARATRALRSSRYARLVDEWAAFLDEPEQPEQAPRDARLPIATVASRRIRKAGRRLARHGGVIDDASPASRLHELRIDGKKLRYLLEFFAGLYPRARIAPLIRSLKQLQDLLGDFNDLSVQQEGLIELIEEVGDPVDAEAARRAVAPLLEQMRRDQRRLRAGYPQAFERFTSAAAALEGILGRGESAA